MRAPLRRAGQKVRGTGLRRVDWVRLLVEHGHLRAEAVGMGARLPATCSIPLATAADLIAEGTPHVTRVVPAERREG